MLLVCFPYREKKNYYWKLEFVDKLEIPFFKVLRPSFELSPILNIIYVTRSKCRVEMRPYRPLHYNIHTEDIWQYRKIRDTLGLKLKLYEYDYNDTAYISYCMGYFVQFMKEGIMGLLLYHLRVCVKEWPNFPETVLSNGG
jgi:hypothetical protein